MQPTIHVLPCLVCHIFWQEMLGGVKALIGHGNIRDVYLIEHGGQKLVVKTLREDFEQRASRARAEKIHRWEAAALDAVMKIFGTCCFVRSTNILVACIYFGQVRTNRKNCV